MRLSSSIPGAAWCLIAWFTVTSTACSKWELESPTPASLSNSTRERTIRVEQLDGRVVELVQVEVGEDTLTGLVPGSAQPGAPLHRVTVRMADVSRVASKRGDLKRFLGAMAAVPLVYFAGSYLMQW